MADEDPDAVRRIDVVRDSGDSAVGDSGDGACSLRDEVCFNVFSSVCNDNGLDVRSTGGFNDVVVAPGLGGGDGLILSLPTGSDNRF